MLPQVGQLPKPFAAYKAAPRLARARGIALALWLRKLSTCRSFVLGFVHHLGEGPPWCRKCGSTIIFHFVFLHFYNTPGTLLSAFGGERASQRGLQPKNKRKPFQPQRTACPEDPLDQSAHSRAGHSKGQENSRWHTAAAPSLRARSRLAPGFQPRKRMPGAVQA